MNGEQQFDNTPEPYGSAHDLPSFVEMRQQLQIFKVKVPRTALLR